MGDPLESLIQFHEEPDSSLAIHPRVWSCEPYQNGQGWFHERGCPHVDWGDEYPPRVGSWR